MRLTEFTSAPLLETDRLRLRARKLDDFPFFRDIWRDPDVTRFIGSGPRPEEETWTKFLRIVGLWQLLGFGYWVIEEKASGALIGEAGLAEFRRDMIPSIAGVPELGYAFAASAHGKGYATEACRAIVAWGDEHMPGQRMCCIIDETNVASLRVAEKCGFKRAETANFHGEEVLLLYRG
jgi:RimJ/RimL family protein N-acetyltransferase